MIDIYDKIRHLLTFESEDDFYYLQILQRKKDNPELGNNSRVIKNYYIKSLDYLDSRYDEIKKLCDMFNARAMLRLNKRSWKNVAFKTMINLANVMSNEQYTFASKAHDKAIGNGHNDKDKKWIIDIDGDVDENFLDGLRIVITFAISPSDDNRIICELPTKNGLHLITSPFNLHEFRKYYPEIDVHKDNPINLYIP